MQMNGLAELITIKHYWEQWADPRLIVAVLHNNDLNQVTWEMRAMEGAPKFTESQQIPDVSYEGFARSLGLLGIAVDEHHQVGPAWDQALAAGRPVVLDFRTDPSIPPIPPHATFEPGQGCHGAAERRPRPVGRGFREGFLTKAREVLPRQARLTDPAQASRAPATSGPMIP